MCIKSTNILEISWRKFGRCKIHVHVSLRNNYNLLHDFWQLIPVAFSKYSSTPTLWLKFHPTLAVLIHGLQSGLGGTPDFLRGCAIISAKKGARDISVRAEFHSGGWSLLPEYFSIACTKIKWFCPNITWFFAWKWLFEKNLGGAAAPLSPMGRTPMARELIRGTTRDHLRAFIQQTNTHKHKQPRLD